MNTLLSSIELELAKHLTSTGVDVYLKGISDLIYFFQNSKLKKVGIKIYEIGDDEITSMVRVTYSCTILNNKKQITVSANSFLVELLRFFMHSEWGEGKGSKNVVIWLLESQEFANLHTEFKNKMNVAIRESLKDPVQIELVRDKISKFKKRIKNRQSNELKILFQKLLKCSWSNDDIMEIWNEIQCNEIMES